jgi:hypothetical protein
LRIVAPLKEMDKAIAIPDCSLQPIGDRLVKRKITCITVTQEELWVLRKPTSRFQLWCEECAGDVDMVPAEKAASLARISARALFRAVENQRLHFKETADGRLLVCVSSLEQFVNNKKRELAATRPESGNP